MKKITQGYSTERRRDGRGYCFSMYVGFQMSHHLDCPSHDNTHGLWYHENPYKGGMDFDLLLSYIHRKVETS